jgi:hypothetical protein
MSTTLALLQTAAEAKNTAAAGSAGFAYGLVNIFLLYNRIWKIKKLFG